MTIALQATLGKNEFFHFTRGRFVRDEAYELAQRAVHFDVDALASIAAKAVGLHSCVKAEKFKDGMFNKALLLTMDDGTQAVASTEP
ncbi:hypothetical protein LTR85_009412 [Meristemomyces frigidus]|nr:hypothetical protein LTR85_009412 [Meristemomyces frigidus]